MIMSKKDNRSGISGLLELTDAELEGVYGGKAHYYPYDDDSDYSSYDTSDASYDWTNSRSNDGLLNIPIDSQNVDNSHNSSLIPLSLI